MFCKFVYPYIYNKKKKIEIHKKISKKIEIVSFPMDFMEKFCDFVSL